MTWTNRFRQKLSYKYYMYQHVKMKTKHGFNTDLILLPLFARTKKPKYMLLDKYYHTVGTVPKSNKNITEKATKSISLTHTNT